MNILPAIETSGQPVLITGPCSAESEEQLMRIAEGITELKPDVFRAGIWKPRTRPGAFEGIGKKGLVWLQKVKETFGYKLTVEVASADHVRMALDHNVDILWIGARSTANPFTVQEIADALVDNDIPILIKNPVNPDIDLWQGAIERFHRSGIRRISAVHRGFSRYGKSRYRNPPEWQIPLELISRIKGLQMICDVSHIAGNRDLLHHVAQEALNLNMDGLMIETHHQPDSALSDAAQQITPGDLINLHSKLKVRKSFTEDILLKESLETLRFKIDQLDKELIEILSTRMKLAEEIGLVKMEDNISIFQPERWKQVLSAALTNGNIYELSPTFIRQIYDAIHAESLLKQSRIMNIELQFDVLKLNNNEQDL
jgi:chorismate mutase